MIKVKDCNSLKRVSVYTILVAVILALALGRIVYLFAFEKTGLHSDEIWSYGLANGYYLPYVYEDYTRENDINLNDWISGEYLKDYITVQPGERFSYGSVIYNLKADFHPPLYFSILHTISSFFPDTYSLWFGFAINIVVFIVLGIYLYKLAKKITGSEAAALVIVVYYVLCAGGVNTFLYIRHYAMLTMFGVMTVYYHYRIIDGEEHAFRKNWWKLLLAVLGGCMTQYMFLGFAFGLAVVYCFCFLIRKMYKKLVVYMGIMLGSVDCVFLLTGFATGVERKSEVDTGLSFYSNFRMTLKCAISDLFGYRMNGDELFYIREFLTTALVIAVVLIPLFGLLVKDKKINIDVQKLKEKVKKGFEFSPRKVLITALISAVAIVWISVVLTAEPMEMGAYTDRYLFVIFPYLIIFTYLFIGWLVKVFTAVVRRIIKRGEACRHVIWTRVPVVLMVVLLTINLVKAEPIYLFSRVENDVTLEELAKDKDCILVLTQHWLLTCYSNLLMDADRIFVTGVNEYEQQSSEYETLNEETILIMDVSSIKLALALENGGSFEEIKKSDVEERFLPYFEDVFDGRTVEYVQEDVIFTRDIYVYRIK
ncbi:MAG: glycosyltransferase family 39 protein [Lachnospiraceae bacterium]|nr:glycosyltransferase family 39 protein [Lachnospiraceae bacterium]